MKEVNPSDMILWLLARYILFIAPMTVCFAIVVGQLFDYKPEVITFILCGLICEKIMGYYEHLDFTITLHILDNRKNNETSQ